MECLYLLPQALFENLKGHPTLGFMFRDMNPDHFSKMMLEILSVPSPDYNSDISKLAMIHRNLDITEEQVHSWVACFKNTLIAIKVREFDANQISIKVERIIKLMLRKDNVVIEKITHLVDKHQDNKEVLDDLLGLCEDIKKLYL